jgi:hypothetical protein
MDEFMETVDDGLIDNEIDMENLDMTDFTGDDGNYEEDDDQNGEDFDS